MGLADGTAWEKEGQVGVKMVTGQGKMERTEFGANREANDGRGRFDLLPYEAMEALAKWYEAGANKYAERNWEKGLSVKDCINRMVRHSLKAANGWTDEDHLAAVMWNAAAVITLMQRRPDCNDHPWRTEEKSKKKEEIMKIEEYLKKHEEEFNKQFEIFKKQCGCTFDE